jgi:hypothetical protein
MDALKTKPCPFCGETDDFGIGRSSEDREGWSTYIYCVTCGCKGPWVYTRDKIAFTMRAYCAEHTGRNKRKM